MWTIVIDGKSLALAMDYANALIWKRVLRMQFPCNVVQVRRLNVN